MDCPASPHAWPFTLHVGGMVPDSCAGPAFIGSAAVTPTMNVVPASPTFASVRAPDAGGFEHVPAAHVAAASKTAEPLLEASLATLSMTKLELAGTETERNCCPKTAGEQPPMVSTPAYVMTERGATPSHACGVAHDGPASNDRASKRNEGGGVTLDQSSATNHVPAVGRTPCAYVPVAVLPTLTPVAGVAPSHVLETVNFGEGDPNTRT